MRRRLTASSRQEASESKARQVRFVSTVQDAARNMGQALVGQHDQTGQIVLKMPKLALVVKQVAEDRRMVR